MLASEIPPPYTGRHTRSRARARIEPNAMDPSVVLCTWNNVRGARRSVLAARGRGEQRHRRDAEGNVLLICFSDLGQERLFPRGEYC
jgi:hypothetical protein